MQQEGTNSLVILYFSWWYGYLPRRLFLALEASMITLVDLFSVKILFRTLFSPWKRDLISTDGLSLQEKFQVWMMNLASRFIGFIVKTFVLITFAIVFVAAAVIFAALFCLWIAFPLAIIGLVILGLTNLA
ncbi:MAG: hypothetical protein NTY30_01950 [Candidatus Berkelbacteria bacterium]|nr:hypothetical protein [Candidatus Berkelbacteria bacterium]